MLLLTSSSIFAYGLTLRAGVAIPQGEPKVTIEAGGSFTKFYNLKYNVPTMSITNNLSAWSIFTGVNISLLFL